MTKDEIIEMARQAGFIFLDGLGDDGECRKYGEAWPEQIEAFAKLVDAKATEREREACAKVCDDIRHPWGYSSETSDWSRGTEHCADAIRARGEAT